MPNFRLGIPVIFFFFTLFHRKPSSLIQCLGVMVANELVNLVAKGVGIFWVSAYIQRQMSVLNPSMVIIIHLIRLDIICASSERFTILGLL